MKKIYLGGKYSHIYTIIDDEDFEEISQKSWYLSDWGYVYRKVESKGKQTAIYLHKYLLNNPKDMHVDHIDLDRLNNTRSNLRIANRSQNQANHRRPLNNTSGEKNIYWHKQSNKWCVKTYKKRVTYSGGLYHSFNDAIKARNELIIRIHGEFARA